MNYTTWDGGGTCATLVKPALESGTAMLQHYKKWYTVCHNCRTFYTTPKRHLFFTTVPPKNYFGTHTCQPSAYTLTYNLCVLLCVQITTSTKCSVAAFSVNPLKLHTTYCERWTMILFVCNSFTLLVMRNFYNAHDAIVLHATSYMLQVTLCMGGFRQ